MSLPVLRVSVASRIEGLLPQVQVAFARSSLNATHKLELSTLAPADQASGDAEVIFGDPSVVVPMLDAGLPKLRWWQSTWAGVNAIMNGTERRDYKLTRVGGVFGQLMADYVLGNVLAHERSVVEISAEQREKRWNPAPYTRPRKSTDLRMALLGTGDIGLVVAQRAKALGMHTVALRRDGVCQPGIDEAYARLEDVVRGAHYVVNILPSTPDTRGMLCGGVLQCCKDAVFINVGRGDIIDEETIINALEQGWLAKAVLDVFPVEPLPTSSPLWEHPRVVITPHVSAPSLSEDVTELFVMNLEKYVTGQDLDYLVDWDKGY